MAPIEHLVPLAVISASFLGSTHCVGMCGGLVSAVSRNHLGTALYHLGRLFAYLILGTASGLVGRTLFDTSVFKFMPWIGATLIGVVLMAMGIGLFVKQKAHFKLPALLTHVYGKLWGKLLSPKQNTAVSAAGVGFLSILLPCGWLYGFAMAAASTQSPVKGAGLLLLFWIGTLPAMFAAPWVIRRVLAPVQKRMPRLAGTLLVGAGLATIVIKLGPLFQTTAAAAHHCH